MKCRDFMVFDWCCNEHGTPMQIINVGRETSYADCIVHERYWAFSDVEGFEPRPIEITAELLKANGWKVVVEKFCDVICYECCVKDENGNHLEWRRGTLSIWLDYEKNNDGVYSDIVIPVKYVHQLQQSLRLAGMTDMANNFKV